MAPGVGGLVTNGVQAPEKRDLIAECWYLSNFLSQACLVPYMPVIYKRHGLGETAIGFFAALQRWCNLPMSTLWSAAADAKSWHLQVTLLGLIGGAGTRMWSAYAHGFWPILASIIVQQLCGSSAYGSIVDAVVVADIRRKGQGEYGRVRLWGAVGWGISAAVAGVTLQTLGLHAVVAIFSVFAATTVALSLFLPYAALASRGDSEGRSADVELVALTSVPEAESSEPIVPKEEFSNRESMWASLLDGEVLVYLASTVVMGYAVGHIEGYLFLYLEDLGGSSLLMGLSLTVTCVSETFVFYISRRIISTLGIWGCQHTIFFAFIVRLAGYCALVYSPSLWLVLPFELLHGLTFGLAWSAGTLFFAQVAPKGREATFQAIYQGAYFGLGHGIGGAVGGIVYEKYGPQVMLAEAMLTVAIGWIAMTALRMFKSASDAHRQPVAAEQ